MVRLEEIGYDDFLSVRADDPADRAAELLAGMSPTRVVIRREHEGQLLYYVRRPDEVAARCRGAAGRTVGQALDLADAQPDPLLDADADAEASPDLCVLHRGGELTGFYDATVPVNAVRCGLRADKPGATTRHIHADLPDAVAVGETVSLRVDVRSTWTARTDEPGDVLFDVLVQPDGGFALVGSGSRQLAAAGGANTRPVEFELRATAVGLGRVRVLCFQQGTPLGSVTVYAAVLPAGRPADGPPVEAARPLAPAPPADADLLLLIRDAVGPHGRCLEYQLKATDPAHDLNFQTYQSGPLDEPKEYFRSLYANLDQRLDQAGAAGAEPHLTAYGATLFEALVPADLQAMLWDLQGRVTTVQVLSSEPWVPWELLKLSKRGADGRVTGGLFLCQAFRLTRWFPGVGRRPALTLRRAAVVVPGNSGLPNAGPERDYFRGLATGGRTVSAVEAKYVPFREALGRGEFDWWHFVGHGAADLYSPDESGLMLEDGTSLRVNDLSGELMNCGLPRPLVFLNACQTGQCGAGVTGVRGWAQKFVTAGAAAFVGTLWSVKDGSAKVFATAFYDRLLAGETVAEAAFAARQAAGPTGLAYTVFADPFARVAGD